MCVCEVKGIDLIIINRSRINFDVTVPRGRVFNSSIVRARSSLCDSKMDKIAVKRLAYEQDGHVIYEWEQTIDEINVFVKSPPGVVAKRIECNIRPGSVTLGVKGEVPFLNGDFDAFIDKSQAVW